jgi:type I restriction enzyme M protein
VSIIDELSITSRNQDVQGDIYEYLLSELNQAGKAGQFRTPRHIIRMMVKLVDPKLGEKICDPACGTAGFLIGAYEHILETNTSKDIIKYDKEGGHPHNLVGDKITDKKHWELLKRNTFYGFDFDATMVRIASMNMILHGIEHPNIKYADTLAKSFQQKPYYDAILANPPFTGSIDTSDIHDALKLKTSKTELLFLELFYNLLNVGGRAAVIVPNGVLFGSSTAHKQVRQLLLEKCRLDAVISMPAGVFQPYSGVGTAVLVFTKGDKTDSVWFYDMQADGYSLDQKRDFIDGKGDIPDIVSKFPERKKSKQSIVVPFSEIKKNGYNLSISQYREVEHEEITYQKPDKIIDKVLKMEEDIVNELKKLKSSLK